MAAHCILVALMLWMARPIVVGADSNLVMARLLQGLVAPLGGRGGLLAGREIAEAIQGESEAKDEVVYGEVQRDIGTVLELGRQVEVRRRLPAGRFRSGIYA